MRRIWRKLGEGREEKERGCAPRVESDERATGVEFESVCNLSKRSKKY